LPQSLDASGKFFSAVELIALLADREWLPAALRILLPILLSIIQRWHGEFGVFRVGMSTALELCPNAFEFAIALRHILRFHFLRLKPLLRLRKRHFVALVHSSPKELGCGVKTP
jgi:hypothetical protein